MYGVLVFLLNSITDKTQILIMSRYICIIFSMVIISGCSNEPKDLPVSANFRIIPLGEGVYGCIHSIGGKAICNAGIIDNGKETIIFDTFLSPGVTEELVQMISRMGLSPVRYVINSHCHNDHIRGNQVFDDNVSIISTLRTKELIEEWEPQDIEYEKEHAPARFKHYDSLYQTFTGDKNSREFQQILMWRPYYEVLMNSHDEVSTRLPDTFVDSVLHLDGPERRVTLITYDAGHTESDLMLYLPNEEIAFTGDIIFNKCHPYLGHGSVEGLRSWLDKLDSMNIRTIVPGHGEIGSASLITEMKDYLSTVVEQANDLVEEGSTPDDIEGSEVPVQFSDWWFSRFYAMNLRFAYGRALRMQETDTIR